jgi:membrane-associated phospholipid phosphatase
VVLGLSLRRRRRKKTIATLLVLGALAPGRALAEPSSGAGASGTVANTVAPAAEPSPLGRSLAALGLSAGAAGSVNDAALAFSVGGRLRASRHWTLGVDAEWNPWLSIDGAPQARAGAFNLFASGIFNIPLHDQRLTLRVTASLGGSRTLIDLYGVPKGTTGLFVGLSPLGVDWRASRLFDVVINPLGIAVPVPQLGGIPFWYPQYRAAVGLELYPGRRTPADSAAVAFDRILAPADPPRRASADGPNATAGADPASSAATTEGVPRSAYRLSFNLDAPLLLLGGALASSFLFLDETGPPACAPLCDRSSVNAFDRPFAGIYHPAWTTVGDVALAGTLLLVPLGVILGEPTWGGLGDLLVVGEAALLTSAVQVLASYAVDRPRPRVYGETAPLDQRDDANAGRSFFSGHVANALAVTIVSTTALFRTRHRTLAWTVLASGLTGSALVGVSRIAAGGHFPSDVLVGYAVGAAVGIALPALHPLNLQVRPIADAHTQGLALAAAF